TKRSTASSGDGDNMVCVTATARKRPRRIQINNSAPSTARQASWPTHTTSASAAPGGLNWSAQHSNLLAKMECGHETATSHLLLGGPAIRDLGSLAGRRADEFDRTPI